MSMPMSVNPEAGDPPRPGHRGSPEPGAGPRRDAARRRLLVAATGVGVFGVLHHVDHAVRGNHVGWPLVAEVTPFTFSLLVYPFLLLGVWLTVRRRTVAGYWLAFAVAALALVVSVHFVPLEGYESPSDIWTPYADPLGYAATEAPAGWAEFFREDYAPYASPLWGALALADLAALVASLLALGVAADRARRHPGRW